MDCIPRTDSMEREKSTGMASVAVDADFPSLTFSDPKYENLLTLISRSCAYLGEKEREAVNSAYHFANTFHDAHSKRHNGDPYITHPVSVTCILAAYHVDEDCLVASLLHDVYEDHADQVSLSDIGRYYGSGVMNIVDGVTKISKVSNEARDAIGKQLEEEIARLENAGEDDETKKKRADLLARKKDNEKRRTKAATVHKLIGAMSKDLRTMMVKLADRVHNMRTLDFHKNELSKKRIAQETLEIFVPIAARVGVYTMRCELEDLSFRQVARENYDETVRQVDEILESRKECIAHTIDSLSRALQERGINAEIDYQTNNIYYIYRKLKSNKRYEVDNIRIVVDDVDTCYRALGVVHQGTIQVNAIHDYLATGKSNGYRALHTSIYSGDGDDKKVVPIHICPRSCVKVNEIGIFAAYNEGEVLNSKSVNMCFKESQNWFKSLLSAAEDCTADLEYVDVLRGDLLSNDVMAFTPMGDPIDLPAGSNPIDFAYRVHTDVGDSCVSARVNDKPVDLLHYVIKPNDVVCIQSSHSATPRREWYKACRTTLARNRIKAWFSKGLESLNIDAGREIASLEMTKMNFARLLKDDNFMKALAVRLNVPDVKTMFCKLGCWQISESDFSEAVRLEARKGYFTSRKREGANSEGRSASIFDMIKVGGGLPPKCKLTWMRCCSVVPGDPIVGYLANNNELRIHRVECQSVESLRKLYPGHFVSLEWVGVGDDGVRCRVGVFVRCQVHSHVVGNVINSFDEKHEHISEFAYKEDNEGKEAEMRIYFKAASSSQVESYMQRLLQLPGVISVVRI